MSDEVKRVAYLDRPLRIAHLTTVDMSLALLLETELVVDLEGGHVVMGISAPGPYTARIEDLGVRHVAIPALSRSWNLRGDAAAAVQLWRAIRGLDLDVLHTHNPKTGVLGRLLGRWARVPVVVNTCHGLWAGPDDALVKRTLVLTIEALASQFSHFELFQNEQDAHALRWAIPRRKREVVGNGIDLSRFRFDADGRARVRAEWGVSPDEVLVGAAGRLVEEKGAREFQHAAQALSGRARFVWVGPDDPSKTDRIGTALPGVELVGERTDMPAVYSALDVFVLPSHREGFSRSAMEAAACGRALVLTDIRGCREIGTDQEHLLLVPVRDPRTLAVAIERLIGDPATRERLGSAAEMRSRAAFDQRVVAQRSLSAYARLGAHR